MRDGQLKMVVDRVVIFPEPSKWEILKALEQSKKEFPRIILDQISENICHPPTYEEYRKWFLRWFGSEEK